MTAIDSTPTNQNILKNLDFRFQIHKAKHVEFFVQKCSIPSLTLPAIPSGNPFVNIPQTGDHITFDELHLYFKVDEDLKNYIEIQGWLFALGFPNTFEEYNALSSIPQYTGDGLMSDCSLLIMNNNKNYNLEITFRDAFPTQITSLDFDITQENVAWLSAGVSFAYTSFKVTNS